MPQLVSSQVQGGVNGQQQQTLVSSQVQGFMGATGTMSMPIRSIPQVNVLPPSKINFVNNSQPVQTEVQFGRQALRVPDIRKEAFKPVVQVMKPQTVQHPTKTINFGLNRPYTPVFTVQQTAPTLIRKSSQ